MRRLIGVVTGLVALALTQVYASAATSGPAPSVSARTTVAGVQLRPLFAAAAWQRERAGWTTTFRSTAPVAGSTTARVFWQSSRRWLKPGAEVLRTSVAYEHQGGPVSNVQVRQDFRVCRDRQQCTRWVKSTGPVPPQMLCCLPSFLSGEAGWRVRWSGDPQMAYVQWRMLWTQSNGEYADGSMRVAL